ncbi:MAG: CheR family methyltransferase [Bacteroidota bacterium]
MTITEQDFQIFLYAVKSSSEYDFSDYSEKSLKRRLAKVLLDHKTNITQLVSKIKNDRIFLEKIVRDITVNTTELFRDPAIWHALKYKILPNLANNENINIWHAGCSTGQEVYSMMILLNELEMLHKCKIVATDLNSDVLDLAKQGTYKYRFNIGYLDNFDKVIKENPFNYEEYNDVPYSKYFSIDKEKDQIVIHKQFRNIPVFKKHDLVHDENTAYIKFDLILCRNVIIYFNYALQNRVFDLFYRNLYENGYFILGMHETILGDFANKFQKRGQYYIKS